MTMQPTQKIPLVLAALLFILAAAAEIATGRSGIAVSDDVTERARQVALARVDEALARHDVPAARRAWLQAYEAARQTRSWRAVADAADAQFRIGMVSDARSAALPRARELYLATLTRARAERSVEGALRAAEGFARLGDLEVAEQALRIAGRLAPSTADPTAAERVESTRGRLLDHSHTAEITF